MRTDPICRARLRVRSNEGLVAVSRAHPDATFVVHGAWPDGDELRLLLETSEVDPGTLRETLRHLPNTRNVTRRSADEGVARFEVSTPTPAPHGAAGDSGVVPSFPLTVEGGWIVGELTTSRDRLGEFRDELDRSGIEYRIESVTPDPEESRLLTDRQQEVLEAAFENGYYDCPHECTLAELAETLEVDASAVSRVLQRAEGRLVGSYLR